MSAPRALAYLLLIPACMQANARANLPASEPLLPAADQPGCTLRIHVDGLRNSIGVVGAAIFKSPDGWPEDLSKTVHHWPTPILAGAHGATAVMENLPPGDYGVVAIHDENKNHKLDRNFIGIPKEGFGFANNPHVGLGPPPFKAAIVHVTCPVTETSIHIIYK
jgi:uncharacterized protein (DUF2141 family)